MDVTCTRLANGDLNITLSDNDSREELIDAMEGAREFWSILCDLFESYSCNGSYTPFDAGDGNPFVGLTNAPCIAECMDYEDDGTQTIEGDFWYYADYQIRCPLEELLANDSVVFTLAR
jgi:hypothetical protein